MLLDCRAGTSVGPDLPDHVEAAGLEVGHHGGRVGLADELDLAAGRPCRRSGSGSGRASATGWGRSCRPCTGPVPVPLFARFATSFVSLILMSTSAFGSSALGLPSFIRISVGLITRTERMSFAFARCCEGTFGSSTRRMLSRTSSAVNARPVEYFTPLRRVNHQVLRSADDAPLRRQVGDDVHVAVVLGQAVVEQRLQRHLAGEVDRVRVELRDARAGDPVPQLALRRRASRRRRVPSPACRPNVQARSPPTAIATIAARARLLRARRLLRPDMRPSLGVGDDDWA